jgi:hypothetical protein
MSPRIDTVAVSTGDIKPSRHEECQGASPDFTGRAAVKLAPEKRVVLRTRFRPVNVKGRKRK